VRGAWAAPVRGLRTAWSDKHIAYQMFDGPSGSGVDDLVAPEINSLAAGSHTWPATTGPRTMPPPCRMTDTRCTRS
jgi:hypothetical protein